MELYIYPMEKGNYIRELTEFCAYYRTEIAAHYIDPQSAVDTYRKIREEFYDNNWPADKYGEAEDPYVIYSAIEEECYKYYNLIEIMQYRTLAMYLCCIYEMWEQQFTGYITKELKKAPLNYHPAFKNKKIGNAEQATKILSEFNVILEEQLFWETIQELRLLVNVIKHSEGTSREELKRKKPNYFCTSTVTSNEVLSSFHTSLNRVSLNISDAHLTRFCHAMIDFWNYLPERMLYTVSGVKE